MIKQKLKTNNETQFISIEETMNYCEQYREQLIRYCSHYFDYEYEYAKDCVQDAYVALFENLNKGIVIRDYKSWLYTVVFNYQSKVHKNKMNHKEIAFMDNERKDEVIENSNIYNPDYIDQMITDKMIEERAIQIISQLNPDEKELYISYYRKHRKLKDIAVDFNVKYITIRKRDNKLKKKLNEKIKEFENL